MNARPNRRILVITRGSTFDFTLPGRAFSDTHAPQLQG